MPGWSPVRTFTATPRRARSSSASPAEGASASRSATKPRKVSPRTSLSLYAPRRAGRSARATASRRRPPAASLAARPRRRSRSSSSSSASAPSVASRPHRARTSSAAPLTTRVCLPCRPGRRTTAVASRWTGSNGSAAIPSSQDGSDARASTAPGSSTVPGSPTVPGPPTVPGSPTAPSPPTAPRIASSRASGAGSSASSRVQKLLTAAQRSTSGSSPPRASMERSTTGRSCVRVPVLSRHRTSIAPRSCSAGSRLTITPLVRARAEAPRASAAVTMTGSISGVRPTATAIANGSVSRPRPRTAAFAISTSGGVSSMKRISVQAMPWTERSNAVCTRRRAGPPYAAANRVSAPVATTRAVALPEATLLPWKHRCGGSGRSAPPSAGASSACFGTGRDSPVSAA